MTVISGTVAVVTGGNRGLGKAIVEELLKQGASKVYATARAAFDPQDDRIVAVIADVTNEDSIRALARQAPDAVVVINNAGIVGARTTLEVDAVEMTQLFQTNVLGPVRVTQAFAPILASNGGGTIVNIHSVVSWGAGAGPYGATKAALWSLSNSLRIELAGQGTQVLGVHVGFIDTDAIAALDVVKLPPAEVAQAVVQALENGEPEVLVDPASRYFKAAVAGPVEGLTLQMS